jgi:hypothetical protein
MPLNPDPESPTNATLHTLLDANLQWPPEYRGQLTNHLSMALHALQGLGASPQRLQDFYTRYSQRFQGQPAPEPATLADAQTLDWRSLRGQATAYPALLAYFNNLVQREGPGASLRQTLPDLVPGVCAAAFHGVIRVAHALQAGHAGELAAALAYWAWRWQALQAPPPSSARLDLGIWATRLVQESAGWRNNGHLISVRMENASHSPVYAALAGALVPADSLGVRIQELARVAVGCYVANPNFTVLHMVTGLRALRTLVPWISDSEQAQALLAHSFVAAYMAAQIKPLAQPPTATAQSWDAVITAAIASDDDHVVKLVHACREEAAVYGEGNYLRAATLVTGL